MKKTRTQIKKQMKRLIFVGLLGLVVLLAVPEVKANCEYSTVTKTGLQTTFYNTNNFSNTFNGPVTAKDVYRSADNQSSNYQYISYTDDVAESVIVRFIDHDISVDTTSSDFYADDDSSGGTIDSRRTGTWCREGTNQTIPFTYTHRTYTYNGQQLQKRVRYIIAGPREVVFITQISKADYGDQAEWLEFANTLRIQ
jgi:hypothetical protein